MLAYSTYSEHKSALSISSLQKEEMFEVAEGLLPFSNLSWQKNGLSLAFTSGNDPQHPQAIYHFIASEKSCTTLNSCLKAILLLVQIQHLIRKVQL